MIDFSAYSQDEIIAKGHYSIVRAAHEEEKEHLALLCGQFASIPPQVLRQMQPAKGSTSDIGAVNSMLAAARRLLDEIEACALRIEDLETQRAALKKAAWGR